MKTTTDPAPLAQRITQGHGIVNARGGMIRVKGSSLDENLANAELLAEAIGTTHETGRTPRQLADERAELLASLNAILAGTAWKHIAILDLAAARELLDRIDQ